MDAYAMLAPIPHPASPTAPGFFFNTEAAYTTPPQLSTTPTESEVSTLAAAGWWPSNQGTYITTPVSASPGRSLDSVMLGATAALPDTSALDDAWMHAAFVQKWAQQQQQAAAPQPQLLSALDNDEALLTAAAREAEALFWSSSLQTNNTLDAFVTPPVLSTDPSQAWYAATATPQDTREMSPVSSISGLGLPASADLFDPTNSANGWTDLHPMLTKEVLSAYVDGLLLVSNARSTATAPVSPCVDAITVNPRAMSNSASGSPSSGRAATYGHRRRHTISAATPYAAVPAPAAAASGISSFQCKWGDCTAMFGVLAELTEHIDRIHFAQASEKKWTCHWRGCGAKKTPSELAADLEAVNAGVAPAQRRASMSDVDASYTGDVMAQTLLLAEFHEQTLTALFPSPSTPPPTIGDKRQLRFDRISKFLAHMRTHTGERPYPCPHPACTLAFTRVDTRRDHIRKIHADGAAQLLADVEQKMAQASTLAHIAEES